ncbi:MAG: hypothetical protein M1820_007657 [Bogoriella megaspora]|nr:MAG: hypothetical protein M1820_007657 [Bogoriella megaspora]
MTAPLSLPALTAELKYDLITSNLQEVISGDVIRKILPVRPLKLYWGTATTGRPHAAYFLPAIKIAQFLHTGCQVKILLADIHGFLDADKAPEGVLEHRAQYYERVIRALLRAVGADLSNLEFVRGSSYQETPKFTRDLFRLFKCVSMDEAKKASSEVVKDTGKAMMADGAYPLMQLLDEEYLDVDAEFGGIDQRKVFALVHDTAHKLGFKTRAHLMNPMIPGLRGGKMSSSDSKSKIDLVDDAETVSKKIAKAECAPGEVNDNGILAFIQHVLLPYSQLQSQNGKAAITVMLEDQTEPTTFTSFAEISAAYEANLLTPQIAKKLVEEVLIKLIGAIRQDFEADPEWQRISDAAYLNPTAAKPQKKSKGSSKMQPLVHDGKE